MSFPFRRLKLCLTAALAAAALSVHAQATMHEGTPILFSSPDNDEASSNVPSLAPQPPVLSGLAGEVQAPVLNFNPGPSAPPPGRMVSPGNIQKPDEKKDWVLMTPEEIMGVKTPEEIMGITERDANGQPNDEPLPQRFLERQEQQRNPTNDSNAYDSLQWDLPGRQTNSFSPPAAIGMAIPANPFFAQPISEGMAPPAQNANGGNWMTSFGSPPTAPVAPTPDQIAADEAFQKLIAPHSSSPEKNPANGNYFSSPPLPTDTLLAKPEPNPLGASFTPLSGHIGQPQAVKPLPGLIQKPEPPPVEPPWTPKPPPWMSSTPQPGEIPQRKF